MTLTVDDLREHVTTDLVDAALQRLMDAAEQAIERRAGAAGARTEIVDGGGRMLVTSRPIDAVTGVDETWWTTTVTLQGDDYRLRADGYLLERLRTGTNPRHCWAPTVTIQYTPIDDQATRDGVEISLVQLAIDENPGKTAEQIGAWMEQFSNNSAWNTTEEWNSILSRLDPEPGMRVVGSGRPADAGYVW